MVWIFKSYVNCETYEANINLMMTAEFHLIFTNGKNIYIQQISANNLPFK